MPYVQLSARYIKEKIYLYLEFSLQIEIESKLQNLLFLYSNTDIFCNNISQLFYPGGILHVIFMSQVILAEKKYIYTLPRMSTKPVVGR